MKTILALIITSTTSVLLFTILWGVVFYYREKVQKLEREIKQTDEHNKKLSKAYQKATQIKNETKTGNPIDDLNRQLEQLQKLANRNK